MTTATTTGCFWRRLTFQLLTLSYSNDDDLEFTAQGCCRGWQNVAHSNTQLKPCSGGGDETVSCRFQCQMNEWIASIVARWPRIPRTAAGPVLLRWCWMPSPRARQGISLLSRCRCYCWLRARYRCVNTKLEGEVKHDSQLHNKTIEPESTCTIAHYQQINPSIQFREN